MLTNFMFLSIIIPTFNEEEMIGQTIAHLQNCIATNDFEIIISDGGSTDSTIEVANNYNIKIIKSNIKGRSGQMNQAVLKAVGDVFYFVHADCLPDKDFFDDIKKAIDAKFNCGSFLTRFDSDKKILRINEFFTKFNYIFFRGGDQSIFVTKELWSKVGSYREEMLIMEDYDFLNRIYTYGNFKLIKKPTLVSARKYDENSWLKVQLANLKVVKMYKKGARQQDMIATYNKMLNYRANAF